MSEIKFTPHTGSEMPCDPGKVVTLLFRNGTTSGRPSFARYWRWDLRYGIMESDDDIVGYFIHPDPEGDFISQAEVDTLLIGIPKLSELQKYPEAVEEEDEPTPQTPPLVKSFHMYVEEAIERLKGARDGKIEGVDMNDLSLALSHLDILAINVRALENQLSWTIKQKDQYENLLAKYEAERKEA